MPKKNDICEVECKHPGTISSVKLKMAPADQLFDLADLFKALGDSTRIQILHALQFSELCVCDLADIISMTQSAVSHQLRVLRAAKIVKYRKEGKNVYYSLDDDHIHQFMKGGLDHINE